jgi:hypothetical protein
LEWAAIPCRQATSRGTERGVDTWVEGSKIKKRNLGTVLCMVQLQSEVLRTGRADSEPVNLGRVGGQGGSKETRKTTTQLAAGPIVGKAGECSLGRKVEQGWMEIA